MSTETLGGSSVGSAIFCLLGLYSLGIFQYFLSEFTDAPILLCSSQSNNRKKNIFFCYELLCLFSFIFCLKYVWLPAAFFEKFRHQKLKSWHKGIFVARHIQHQAKPFHGSFYIHFLNDDDYLLFLRFVQSTDLSVLPFTHLIYRRPINLPMYFFWYCLHLNVRITATFISFPLLLNFIAQLVHSYYSSIENIFKCDSADVYGSAQVFDTCAKWLVQVTIKCGNKWTHTPKINSWRK